MTKPTLLPVFFFALFLLTACGSDTGNDTKHRRTRREKSTGTTGKSTEEPDKSTAGKSVPSGQQARVEQLTAKLYLEASGSMFPYDAPTTNGEFKRAITQLLTPFENQQPGQTQLFVANDKVYDLDLSFNAFIKKGNLYDKASKKGNASYTDFDLIFGDILTNLNAGEVAVLASDLIYSPRNPAGISTQKVMNMGEELMTNAFGPYRKTHSVLVLQLEADFQGTYYPQTGGKPKSYSGPRPYYLVLMARNATMQQFLANRATHDFTRLPGFQNFYLFTDAAATTPFYTILVRDAAKKGNFSRNDDELKAGAKATHAIESIEADRVSKGLSVPVAVNFSTLYLPGSTLTDASQYSVEGKDNFRVSRATAYGETPGPQGTTHKLVLTTDKPTRSNRTATIRLRRSFPPRWVTNSHTETDTTPDAETTVGLQNLLRGIERAYNPTNQPYYCAMMISLAD